jgi:hypothetical protein
MTTRSEHEPAPNSEDAIEAWLEWWLSPLASASNSTSRIPGGTVRLLTRRMGEKTRSN